MTSRNDSHDEADDERDQGGSAAAGRGAVPAPVERPVQAQPFLHIYKPGQGSYVRWSSAVGAGVIGLAATWFLSEQMTLITRNQWAQTLVPVIALVALGYLIFRLIGQNRGVVDFMIATEGEMKKVNWSTRREVLGSTKVVIVVVLALGFILFFVDVFFMFFFELIGVLRIGMLKSLFGGGGEG